MGISTQVVKIGDVVVSDNPDQVLAAYGLSSCVVVCLYDPRSRIGGMLHALLPTRPNNGRRLHGNPGQYVDQGVQQLISSMQRMGAQHIWLQARLCGGATLLPNSSSDLTGNNGHLAVGERNVQTAVMALKAARIRLFAQATGGTVGRTVKLFMDDGRVIVKTLGGGEQVLE